MPGCYGVPAGAGDVGLLTPGAAVLVGEVVEVAVGVLDVRLVGDVVDVAVDALDVRLVGAVVVVVVLAVDVDAVFVTVVVGVVVTVVVRLTFFVALADPPKNVVGCPLPVMERPATRSGTVKTATTIAKATRPLATAISHRGRQ